MDTTLESLWRDGRKPFHGATIFSCDGHTVTDAIEAIGSTLRHIELYYPSARLRSFDDWHEHDGIVFGSKAVSLTTLREQISSPGAYVKSHSDDHAVYRAIYPESLDFGPLETQSRPRNRRGGACGVCPEQMGVEN